MTINKPLSSTKTKSWDSLHRKAVKKNRFSFIKSNTLFKDKPSKVEKILPFPKEAKTFDNSQISNVEDSSSRIIFKAIK